MRLSLSLIVAVATSVNAASFFTGEWAENLKHFFRQTQQSIEQKSGHLLAGHPLTVFATVLSQRYEELNTDDYRIAVNFRIQKLKDYVERHQSFRCEQLSKKVDSAQNFVQRSKSAFSTLAQNLKSGSEKLKATVMETAETTLRGAGDEVEGFFSEVPNRVNDGFDELLAKLGEACSWIFKNIIAPILFIIILLGLGYIFTVSGLVISTFFSALHENDRGF